jgi:hypothetical protein
MNLFSKIPEIILIFFGVIVAVQKFEKIQNNSIEDLSGTKNENYVSLVYSGNLNDFVSDSTVYKGNANFVFRPWDLSENFQYFEIRF